MKQLLTALTPLLLLAAGSAIGTTTTLAAVIHTWDFGDSGAFLEDTTGSNNFTTAGTGTTQVGNTASLNGNGTLDTGADIFGTQGDNPTWSIEMVLTLDSIPTNRTAFASELAFVTGGTSGWEFYTESSGALIMDFSGTNPSGQGNNAFFVSTNLGQGGDAGFTLAAGKQFYIAASVDLSNVNADAAFDSASVTFFMQNITDGGALQSVTTTRTMRNLSNGTGTFSVGGREGATGNLLSADIDSVILSNSLIPEPSSTALLGLGALALIARRRRN